MPSTRTDYDSPPSSGREQQFADASKSILLSEYTALLRSIEPVRILNRAILIGLALLQFNHPTAHLIQQLFYLLGSGLASGFWSIQQFQSSRKLSRLGEMIAATNGELAAGTKEQPARPVVLPPLKSAEGSASNQEPSTVQPSPDPQQDWTITYVNWRHEAWTTRHFRALEQAEPAFWFALMLAFTVLRLFAAV